MAETNENIIKRLAIWHGPITIEPLQGGVSNVGYKVIDAKGAHVVRLGHDYPFHQVSRAREAIAARAAFHAGLSPEVVHTEEDIMVLRFITAKTYAEIDVRRNWQACVDIVKQCHHTMPGRILGQGAIFWVFQIIRDYGATLVAKNHARAGEVRRWLDIVDRAGSAASASAHHFRPS